MSIKQEFKFTPSDGKEFVTLYQWVDTLSATEQEEFKKAEQRQLAIRQQVISDKKLTIVKNSFTDGAIHDNYVWDESAVENKTLENYKDYDETWVEFWGRYLEETNTKFEIIETNI
jgi:hypothetical protein